MMKQDAHSEPRRPGGCTRRDVLKAGGSVAAVSALAGVGWPAWAFRRSTRARTIRSGWP